VTELRVVEGDITTMAVDAIVNAANSSLLGGGGVDGAIHRAAGPALLAECREVVAGQGGCAPGAAVHTGAGRLPASMVIHTVGPVWTGSDPEGQEAVLASCYRESIRVAVEHSARTIAFPNISTGVYGFPHDRAARVAVATVTEVVNAAPDALDSVLFVCFEERNTDAYRALLGFDDTAGD
jgi:O-acetyl-ADP-ribose deacetylase (regulator of RNase III)